MSSWKLFQRYSRQEKNQVLSRYSGRCIPLFVSWFVLSASWPVHLSFNFSRHQTTMQRARLVLWWIGSERDFSSKVRTKSHRPVKIFFRYWFKPTAWKKKFIRCRKKMCCLVCKISFWTGAYTNILLSEIPTFIIAGHETTRYTCPSLTYSAIEIYQNLNPVVVSPWHGHYILYLRIKTFKRNFVKRYLICPLIIHQWMIWMDCHIWMLSYAKLCVFIRQLVVLCGRRGRMTASLLVSRSRTRRELFTMKSGKLLIRFLHYILIFCVDVGDIGSERVNWWRYLSASSTEINLSGGKMLKNSSSFRS